jgi:hypothetical protein
MATQEPLSSLIAVLQRLPQAGGFTPTQVEAWASALIECITADPHGSGLTLEQHLRRLGGFGASEIGVLVGERRGDYSPFMTARELVARKLLLERPPPADNHLRRGIVMEPLVRAEFLRRSGAIRRADLTQQVATHTPTRWPWMQATPDDLLDINGVLGVVDYKVPAEPLADLSLAQKCQLHQIRLLAEDLGLPIRWQAIIAWNHPRGGPDVFLCEHDPALAQALIDAGEHYWRHHVLTGELPPWPVRTALALNLADLPLEAKAEIEDRAARYLRFDLLAKEAKNLTEAARERLLEVCRTHRLADTVTSDSVQIKPRAAWNREAVEARLSAAERIPFLRPQWDVEALVDLVRAHGGNPEAACTGGEPTLDLNAAAHWLMETQGLPESALRTTDYQASLSRRKADQALVEPLREAARAVTDQFSRGAPAP